MANAELFAQLLTDAVYRIRSLESKSVSIVQDELGYALEKKGGASIEYWRKGFTPSKSNDIEKLAREVVRRTDFDAAWLKKFLLNAEYPYVDRLCSELFPATALRGYTDFLTTPLGTAATQTSFFDNLPPQPTPFVGRHMELAQIIDRLNDPDCRLITLIGPGGIGKSRLAIEAGMKLAANPDSCIFNDGICFVPVAALESEDLLVATIADALNYSFFSGEQLKGQLLSFLREKKLLLLIDNLEHLLSGVETLTEILLTAPHVNILATSRQRLNLREEWVLEIQGMDYPRKGRTAVLSLQPTNFDQFSSVQLFIQNASRIRADFSPTLEEKKQIGRICRHVEGIPLAIELAATWVRMLSCEEIAAEIEQNYDFLATNWRDIPERHRSLQAVFDYSWEILTDEEKSAIQKLSIFSAGFQREAAAIVADTSLLNLSTLVDKSFLSRKTVVYHGRTVLRYEMHDLLRKYAREKLTQDPQAKIDAQEKHCRYFGDFLQEREAGFKGGRQTETLAEIGEDIENIRSGWRWAVQNKLLHEISRYLEGMYYFYEIRSWVKEGDELFNLAIEQLTQKMQSE